MNQETVTISRSMFEQVQHALKVSVPEDVIDYYSSEPRSKNDFTRTMIEICEKGSDSGLVVQITPEFAKQIIIDFNALNPDEKIMLEDEIKRIDAENFNWFTTTLSYLLIDGVRKYDVEANRFNISVIEAAYKKLNSDVRETILILTTWVHCGGWGGLILRGAKIGYNGGGAHDQFQEVEYNNKKYEYSSNYYSNAEEHHLAVR